MNQKTSMEVAFQSAVQNLSKKKQLEIITEHIYKKYDIFSKFKPLAIGIDKDLIIALPQYDSSLIIRFLSIHCKKAKYIRSLSLGGKRFNLNGRFKGEVSELEQQHALNHPFVNKLNNIPVVASNPDKIIQDKTNNNDAAIITTAPKN